MCVCSNARKTSPCSIWRMSMCVCVRERDVCACASAYVHRTCVIRMKMCDMVHTIMCIQMHLTYVCV